MGTKVRFVEDLSDLRYVLFEFGLDGYLRDHIYILTKEGEHTDVSECDDILSLNQYRSTKKEQLVTVMGEIGGMDWEDIDYYKEEIEDGLIMVVATDCRE
ncbi:hypothetical protein [Ammoniphilus sp. CFH 90114]|uniref:hypothetical protein n=1 Tax=Ammoniphilus sp. CFH 90114 TaxID=2493665 RepID=UPI00100F2BAB|nr:hypothetical protein [Ammoniphilus sp. CFH 90114]RXT15456.1 hypothetical protein EIZ39_04480 [Ammoniphilus sp. CFH 90114]